MALYKGTQPLAYNIEVKQVAPPVKNVDIDDATASLDSTYSSEKIEELIAGIEANAAESYHFYNTPAQLGLGSTFTSKDIVNKLRDLSRATYPADDVVVYIGNINRTKMTDAPSGYGLLQVFHSGNDFTSIKFSAVSNGDSLDTYIGKVDAPSYNQAITTITWEKITTDKIIDITTLADLGLTSPTTDIAVCQAIRTLVSNNGGKPVNAVLNVSRTDVITGCPADYGLLKVEVRNGDRHRITFDAVNGAKSIGSYIGNITTTDSSGLWTAMTWQRIEGGEHSITANTKTLKITIERANAYWYGGAKVISVGSDYIETDINFTNGAISYVCNKSDAISSLTANVVNGTKTVEIGITYAATQYGVHEVLFPNALGCATISAEAFTGSTTGVNKAPAATFNLPATTFTIAHPNTPSNPNATFSYLVDNGVAFVKASVANVQYTTNKLPAPHPFYGENIYFCLPNGTSSGTLNGFTMVDGSSNLFIFNPVNRNDPDLTSNADVVFSYKADPSWVPPTT